MPTCRLRLRSRLGSSPTRPAGPLATPPRSPCCPTGPRRARPAPQAGSWPGTGLSRLSALDDRRCGPPAARRCSESPREVEWLELPRRGQAGRDERVIALLKRLRPGASDVTDGLWTDAQGQCPPRASDGIAPWRPRLDIVNNSTCRDFDSSERSRRRHISGVAIDEAESLQSRAAASVWLKEHFPKIQFLVTTHSPFIARRQIQGPHPLPPRLRERATPLEELSRRSARRADDAVLAPSSVWSTPPSSEAPDAGSRTRDPPAGATPRRRRS